MIMNADPAGDPNSRVERIYWSVAPVAIRGVTDGARTALTELVAEMSAGQEVPDRVIADQAFDIAVRGIGNRVTIANAQSSERDASANVSSEMELRGFWTPARQIGAFAAGSASVAGLALALWQQGWLWGRPSGVTLAW